MTDKLDDVFARLVRMLGNPIGATSAVRELAAVGKINGVPPSWTKPINNALNAALERARNQSERRSIGEAIASLPTMEWLGRAREPERRREQAIVETLEWLHLHLGARWTRNDAVDLLAHMESIDAANRRNGVGVLQGRERIKTAKDLLQRPRYVNHCWNCPTEINSRFDALCDLCRRYYRCSRCGKCLHDKPDAQVALGLMPARGSKPPTRRR